MHKQQFAAHNAQTDSEAQSELDQRQTPREVQEGRATYKNGRKEEGFHMGVERRKADGGKQLLDLRAYTAHITSKFANAAC